MNASYAQEGCFEDTGEFPSSSPSVPESVCGLRSVFLEEGNVGVGNLPIMKVLVNVHFEKKSTNFPVNEGIAFAHNMINSANWHMQNMEAPDLQLEGIFPDSRIRHEIFSDPTNSEDEHNGIWFWDDNWERKYDNVIDIRIQERSVSATGSACGYNICTYVRLNSVYSSSKDANAWGGFLSHEIFHTFGLCHSFFKDNKCKDIDLNIALECHSAPSGESCGLEGGCSSWNESNNIMNYGDRPLSLTPCQWSIV